LPDCHGRDAVLSRGGVILLENFQTMNNQDTTRPADGQPSALIRFARAEAGVFSGSRLLPEAGEFLSPGHYLIRLRQHHASGPRRRQRRWFVTQS